MDNDERPSAGYRFDHPTDVLTMLDTLGIEHLEVSDERTIIIYNRAILNAEVTDGQLHDARTVTVEVFDLTPDMDAAADALPLIGSLIEELATTAEVDWDRL